MNVSKHPIFAPLFYLVLFSLFKLKSCTGNGTTVVHGCPEIEKQALLSFKQSLHDPRNCLSSWNDDGVNCCKWEGVRCSNLTGHVQQLNLQMSGLRGKVSPSLHNLKNLKYLDLSYNNLQNIVSNSIANLTSLMTLDLSNNELSGNIPKEIGNLCKLQYLHLGQNMLQGGVSGLLGNISACFLGSLEFLDLSDNQLSGPLTNPFGEFKRLRYLVLGRNSMSGVIPSNLGNLSSSLEELYLRNNNFTGNLPESIGQLSNLQYLRIEYNHLEGFVTETHFANLSRLEQLVASRNNLALKVNPNWIPPFKLFVLHMGSWNLGSPIIPPWLDTQKTSIQDLDLSNTGIYGNVPNWFWSIGFLDLSHNQLHGNIPFISELHGNIPFLCNPFGIDYIQGMQFVYLGSNRFSGQLPRVGRMLRELDLSNNSFSGDLSEFLCNTTYGLSFLDLGGNQLTGELPNCFMKWSLLYMLDLGNNNLSGRIPNSIEFLTNLRSLNLNGNNFSGHIPLSMRNCTGLQKVDLSRNNLSGNLPESILTSLTGLFILILKSNKLSGQITPSICQLNSLQILDLSDNMFSGMIPTCVDSFTAMATKRSGGRILSYSMIGGASIESASMTTKGMELTYNTILLLVTGIDLSRNNLSGHIPKEITSLVELRTLNLSRNHLTGPIPRSIGNMTQLESLDLSINSLSGELPISFTVMSSLDYLNVSHNNLTGRIPESTQLQGFSESRFIGNNLCGPPLTIPCSNINDGKAPAGIVRSKDEESDKPEIEWLYVFISLGYGVGLSGFLSTLYLKRSWWKAYCRLLDKIWDDAYVYILIKWTRLARARASAGPNM